MWKFMQASNREVSKVKSNGKYNEEKMQYGLLYYIQI